MRIVPLASIEIRKRQRRKIEPGPLNELKESILGRGLLHPPVVWFGIGEADPILCVGERRLSAIRLIAKENKSFHCNGETIPPGSVPVLTLAEWLDEAGRFEAELDENIHRVDLSWQEKTEALADLHAMRKAVNPDQTYSATAREIQTRTGQPVQTDAAGRVAGSTHALQQDVRNAVLLAPHLDNPKIAKARNAEEALSLVLKSQEEILQSALIRRRLSSLPSTPDIEIHHDDAIERLPKLKAGTFDLILADPPYGIDADSGGFRSRTVHHHNYADTVEAARSLARTILTEGFRLCSQRANLFLFTDIKHWEWLQTISAQLGWTPFRTPIVWQKSESEGLAPWGGAGFRRTYELIFFATKGQRGLLSSPVDILEVRRVPRKERIHAAEKPVELLRTLIGCSTLVGDRVLDPCCGSGSTLVACRELKRSAVGIERDADFYTTAMANVYGDNDGGRNESV